jgi:hypothetical protein
MRIPCGMDSCQHAEPPTLLSNARALFDSSNSIDDRLGLEFRSRVLQEYSANCQVDLQNQHTPPFHEDYKRLLSSPSANHFIPSSISQSNLGSHHYGVVRGKSEHIAISGHYSHASRHQHIRDLERRFTYLQRKLDQTEAYRKYRDRQIPVNNKQEDRKWPEHLERAFFKGKHLFFLLVF